MIIAKEYFEEKRMSNKIILNLAISLDGFIADNNGGYDWIQPSGDRNLNTDAIWSHDKFLEQVSTVIMGRGSYDKQLHTDYSNKQIYVVTSKPTDDYDNVHFVSGDICRTVKELKRKETGDIYLFGGGISIDPILKAGLIEEYVIGIIPIILGDGIPLFLNHNPVIPLHLTHYYVEDGIVVLRYIPRQDI